MSDMSDMSDLFSCTVCCNACSLCYLGIEYEEVKEIKSNVNNVSNVSNVSNVLFFYDKNEEKIDKNIHQIIFYKQYIQGYYEKHIVDQNDKKILLIYINENNNSLQNDISSVIKYVHSNGLSLKKGEKKWNPKQIWVFNY